MNTEGITRNKKETMPKGVDLTKPLDKTMIAEQYPEEDCFGKMWSARSEVCSSCAVNEICCTLYKDFVNKEVKEKEKVRKKQKKKLEVKT